MNSSYILITLLIFIFTFNPYLKKKASQNVSSNEFIIIYNLLAIIFIILYVGYLLKYKGCSLMCFKKLNRIDLIWSLLAVSTGIIGSIILLMLLKNEAVSYIIPNVQGIVILLGGFVGYFIFKEKLDKFKIIGMTLIFGGILSLNYGKLKND